ncbi:MAG: 2,3-bisphosphoglycerate-independent phosphoglycerate mutase [Candidatus Moanabacter tarae]|uniref:2,3-bisphosphoglycerate-independent phosphoglycerate mutase n=1 Tax=Candidatus Moanibacter tarae TaxID=2200854 RepID=A0A2Z4ALD2_9BACT|nr:MAG: 2,3-bisphosphoglycerate-independent phosphoglycerate mutase [Candidatus Moanabacter tarae]
MRDTSVTLIIRDGWGVNHRQDQDPFNAVKLAQTPIADRITQECPRTEISASGEEVGLYAGVMGNSEVGHQNIGAGRIVQQQIVRIDEAFKSREIRSQPAMGICLARLKETGGNLHLIGLASDVGVHSVLRHLYGLIEIAKELPENRVFLHLFTDGRDSPPFDGLRYIREIEKRCHEIGLGRIATVCGRYWGMDRDQRWERVELAYECLVGRRARSKASNAVAAVKQAYSCSQDQKMVGDEFILPTWIVDSSGNPIGRIKNGDSVLFFNFRGDRPREITRAFISDSFVHFDRGRKLDLFYATLTDYEHGLCRNVIFPKAAPMRNTLGSLFSDRGIRQFRCAETEKYPHVTYFFNDYREEPFLGEERRMVPSPRNVTTYDQKPEMSACKVTEATCRAILSRDYPFVMVNFANPDMVGHTGSLESTVQACEVVDQCVEKILASVHKVQGSAMITADHGNAEQMWDPISDTPHTSHTFNPVEVVLVGEPCRFLDLKNGGCLADISPTILQLMDIGQASEMTGKTLIR